MIEEAVLTDIEETYSATPMQQGMLFHALSGKQPGVDIEQIVCILRESVDFLQLDRAWQRVAEVHPTCRTCFRWEGLDQTVQDVHSRVKIPFHSEDWRHLSGDEQEHSLKDYLHSDRSRGFDLAAAPLLRLALFRMGEEDYRLVWTFHHIILDGRSQFLILKQTLSLYDALCQGQEIELAKPKPYRNYAEWIQQIDLEAAEGFWKKSLQGLTAPTPLVVDTPTGEQPPEGHGELQIRLSQETTSALEQMGRDNQLSMNNLVQGAWALLLNRYSGEQDIVFGATRSGRYWCPEGAKSMAGTFINTLPVRVGVRPESQLIPWLKDLRAAQIAQREYEHTPLVKVQRWSSVPQGTPLFESILVYDSYLLNSALQAQGGQWLQREFRLLEQTNYPLTLYGYGEPELLLKLSYDRQRFDDDSVERMLGHLATLLQGIAAATAANLADLTLLTDKESRQLLKQWNDTGAEFPELCLHQLFEKQVHSIPDQPAVVFRQQQLSYRQLDERANQIAHRLRDCGIGPETVVGIYMERSLEMMAGLLATFKAGGAYLPLDPSYPAERLSFILGDAQVAAVLTQPWLAEKLDDCAAPLIELDSDWEAIADEGRQAPPNRAVPDNLAYAIYTSGSTGKPKGVMVSHRNVANFFTGMDQSIGNGQPGAWLAVTSISFDISVLELFWTLARGFKVVLQAEDDLALSSVSVDGSQASQISPQVRARKIDFSLFYFAADQGLPGDKYRLLREGVRYADQNGFTAVWTPERHFHDFGGLYPNPSVIGASLAAITEHVQIRAGSVVLPLHSPIRVAEEWSVIDNISHGRAAISFASGWQPNDFVLAPTNYEKRKELMFEGIETVRKLWRGESVTLPGVGGKEVTVRTLPRPVQEELPIWVTAGGSPETFRRAGEIGAGVLTHLLGQTLKQLAEKIQVYREAWRKAGHGPGQGQVTLMLHTYIGEDLDAVREIVRAPFSNYLRTSLNLVKMAPLAFPNFSRPSTGNSGREGDLKPEDFTEEDMQALVDHAFNRYFETSGLFGTPESCLEFVDGLKSIEVDEIACLVDFGIEVDSVLSSLDHLDRLRQHCNREGGAADSRDYSVPLQISRHSITHLQCTPSMAKILTMTDESLEALKPLRRLMLGGEALPASLARQMGEAISGELLNMYGPTETTIWSSTYRVSGNGTSVSIGKPIANTEIYLLDPRFHPVPVGVPGELLIGGQGVTRGYLKRPSLTAERFVPDPFSGRRGSVLYRTGDLARYLPDGNIEFLGREDHQVKIRGYRIELGEIEAALEKHPSLREAVVMAREDQPGEKRLVAYYTIQQPPAPSIRELRELLLQTLPDFMVPSAFMALEKMPLTPNGKVNRRALPAPKADRAELGRTFVAPRTAVEEKLSQVWKQVLRIERLGVHDDFFDLGGDSILAVQIIARASQAGIRMTVQQLLDLHTIAKLAEVAGTTKEVEAQQRAVTGAVTLTPIQRWLLAQDVPDLHHYNQTMLLEVPHDLDVKVLAEAVRHLLMQHDALRLRLSRTAMGWEQFNADIDSSIPLTEVDLSDRSPADQKESLQSIIDRQQAALNLSEGPVFSATHFRMGEGPAARLLLVGHHLAIDGISWRILLEDLQTACQQMQARRSVQLPAKSTSFQEWAGRLASYARSNSLRSEAEYWLSSQPREFPPLPADFPEGENLEGSARKVTVALTDEETRQLLQEVPAAYNTQINDVLLTALTQAFSDWTGQPGLLLDLEGHGREGIIPDVDISRTVGWFTSLYPVFLDLHSVDGLGPALKKIKESLRRLPQRGIGYGILRYLSGDPELIEKLENAPQAQVQFNYLGQFGQIFAGTSLFGPAPEPPGAFARVASPRQPRPYQLEILGIVVDQRLEMMWHYSQNLHQEATIQQLAEGFLKRLRSLITHCCSRQATEFTPSDFPLADLNQDKLDLLYSKLRNRAGR